METPHLDLDRVVPDRTPTDNLPSPLAAEVDFLAGRTGRWLHAEAQVSDAMRARALILDGSTSEAIVLLEGLGAGVLSPHELVAATWSVSRVRVPGTHATLAEQVEMCGHGFLIDEGIPLGTVSMLQGFLAVAAGNLDEAVAWFRLAVTEGDARAPFWGALARLELARVQLTTAYASSSSATSATSATSVTEDARRNLGTARTFFTSAGYTHLGKVTKSLLELCADPEATTGYITPADRGNQIPVAAPLLGILRKDRGQGLGAASDGRADAGSRPVWHAGFGVQPPARIVDRRGLEAIAYVIASRHREVPSVEIAAMLDAGSGPGAHDHASHDPGSDTTGILAELAHLRSVQLTDPDDLSDELRALIQDDRQRSRVSKLISRTISSLREEHGSLATHLTSYMRTGYLCAYSAPPRVRWVL